LARGLRLESCLALVALCFAFAAAITLLDTPRAANYEIDLYDSFPATFWFSVVASVGLGQVVILRNAFSEKSRSGSWILGMLPIGVSTVLLLAIPFARGYPVYGRGDVMTHIGYIVNILNDGVVSPSNMYPIDHILAAETHIASGTDVYTTLFLVPCLFSLTYILNFAVLARWLFEDKTRFLVLLSLASVLMLGYTHLAFSPFPQSQLLIPFVLFLYLKWRTSPKSMMRYTSMVTLLSICIVFFHPLTSIILLAILLIADPRTYSKIAGFTARKPAVGTGYRLPLLIVTIFVTWHTYLYLIVSGTTHVIDWYALDGFMAKSELESYSDLVTLGNPSLTYLASYVLSQYGQVLILGVAGLACIFLALKGRENRARRDYSILFSTAGFLLFSILAASMGIMATIVGLGRLFPVIILFSIILIAASTPRVASLRSMSSTGRTTLMAIFAATVILLTLFSTFNLFPSPITNSPNYQVTHAEIEGMEFFFGARNSSYEIIEFGPSQRRWHDAIYGTDPFDSSLVLGESARPIDHFGYDMNDNLGDSYNHSTYFILSEWGRQFYPSIYPEFSNLWRFTPDDFQRLDRDPSASLVSTNGDFSVYVITPT